LEIDNSWPLRAIIANPSDATDCTIMIGGGEWAAGSRSSEKMMADRALAAGRILLHVELLGFGSLRPTDRYTLLLNALGRPLLGLQVAQLSALVVWLNTLGQGPVTIEAVGMTAAVVALFAAARTPGAFSSIETNGLLSTFDTIVESPHTFTGSSHALICHGLRSTLDVPDLLELAAPVKVRDSLIQAVPQPGATVSRRDQMNT